MKIRIKLNRRKKKKEQEEQKKIIIKKAEKRNTGQRGKKQSQKSRTRKRTNVNQNLIVSFNSTITVLLNKRRETNKNNIYYI